MMQCSQMLCLLSAIAGAAVAQQKGDVPPPLVWDKLKGNCPSSLGWKSLQGKVVMVSLGDDDVSPQDVVDWNEVPQALQGQPVVFLRVVSGSEFLLDQALEKTPYEGCLLLDSHDANRKNFKLPNVPRTVIVDQAGSIAGYSRGGPYVEDVRAVLNHEIGEGLAEVPPQPKPLPAAGLDLKASYDVHINLAVPKDWREFGPQTPDTYAMENQSLKLAIFDLWDTPMARISFPRDLDSRNYNITAHTPVPNRELLVKLVRDAIQKQFGLRVESELRTQHVYLLTAAENTSSHLKPADEDERPMAGGDEDSIIGTSQTMREIAAILEDMLQLPVLDETNLEGKYDYSVSSHLHGTEATLDMAHQLGLELTPADRPIQMLVVTKK